MAFSTYLEQALLKQMFGSTAYTAPTSYTVGLSFTDPIAVGILEPTGGAYARVTVANSGSNWNVPIVDPVNGGYKTTNAATISFPTATANWVNGVNTNLGYYFIYDNASTPNLIAAGALVQPKVVYTGDSPSFASGQLSVSLV